MERPVLLFVDAGQAAAAGGVSSSTLPSSLHQNPPTALSWVFKSETSSSKTRHKKEFWKIMMRRDGGENATVRPLFKFCWKNVGLASDTRAEHISFPPQEQLSNQIASLIHSFHDVDGRKCDLRRSEHGPR